MFAVTFFKCNTFIPSLPYASLYVKSYNYNFINNNNFTRFYSTPNDRKYSKTHEWIKLVEKEGTIGITDFAQKSLGDVVFVDLPTIGKKVKVQSSVGAIESVKAASDIYSPIAGQVSEVNEKLSKDPSLINSSPYDQGWVTKVKADDLTELNLMDAGAFIVLHKTF